MLKRIRDLFTRRAPSTARNGSPDPAGVPAAEVDVAPPIHRGPKVVHQPIPQSDLDPEAVKIVQRLTRFDHAAYLVGGCVRDLLLERKPKDFDIGTSATPRQIKRLFRNCRIIGRRFRLAHIYFQNGKVIEVATFRAQDDDATASRPDGSDEDLLIRDDNQFGTMEQDALRRDFTINSLFYDVNQGTVLDHADGLGDLRRRVVRTIGDPTVRFKEDPIRILRAIKFAARLDFEIEPETLDALIRTRQEIPKAAAPRILEEINRFCRGGAARRSFEMLRSNGIFEIIAPEIARRYDGHEARWSLLFRLLEDFDRPTRDGDGVSTGRILCALLLPAMLDDLGWKPDGTVGSGESRDVRDHIDTVLRPLATRLRISRKDQEHCRQVFAILQRLVPVGSMHRNTRRSTTHRPSYPDARALLVGLHDLYGGVFSTAAGAWPPVDDVRRRSDDLSGESREHAAQPTGAQGEPRRRRKRRGSRGGASRRTEPVGSPRPSSDAGEPSRSRAEAQRLPPVWDDDYFFAALPSVPEGEESEIEGNRYGSVPLAADPSEEVGDSSDGATDDAGSAKPRRKRRSRRRRRRPPATPETPPADDDESD